MFTAPRRTQNHVTAFLGCRFDLRSVTFLLVVMSFAIATRAQSAPSVFSEQPQNPAPPEITAPVRHITPTQTPVVQEKHPRLFGIFPTYSVSNSQSPISLSSGEKFHLFLKNTTDPFSLTYTAFNAGLQQADNDLSGFGQGATGYGKRLGAGLADGAATGFFQDYLFPSLLHQDPRYFRQGSGPFKSRLTHAIIRPVVTRKDSGGHAFNWSGILGSVAASCLSNAYYPATDRGPELTFKRMTTGIPFTLIDHLIDEFGPDLEKKFLQKK